MEETENNQLALLKERKNKLVSEIIFSKRTYILYLGFALIMLFAAFYAIYHEINNPPASYWNSLFKAFVIMFCLTGAMAFKLDLIKLDAQQKLQDLEFDIELYQYPASAMEMRADKLLRINDVQLLRYYDRNLKENARVFTLGIVCIGLGVAVICATLYFVLYVASSLDTKVITGVIGLIGSLFTNYVAAIFLKMHASASTLLGSFHSRLVETHQLLLTNLLASRIEDNDMRWKTLSELALNVSKLHSK